MNFAIFLRSATKRFISSCRASSSGARKIERMYGGRHIGCTRGLDPFAPVLRDAKTFPSKACAAVAPRQTITFGRSLAISASSHGRHAAISAALGFLWMRRFPRGSQLKCFTHS